MDNSHNLRSRKNAIINKDRTQIKKTSLTKIATNNKKSVISEKTEKIANSPTTIARTSLYKRTSIPPNPTTTLPRSFLARTSLPKRTSITPNPVHSTGILKSHASNQSPTVSFDKLKSIESRIKSIEENYIQESRLTTIETALSQLRADNIDLQLTVNRLKSDIESSQFVLSQLCAAEAKFKEAEDRCIRLITRI